MLTLAPATRERVEAYLREGGRSQRQIARLVGCAHTTVGRAAARIRPESDIRADLARQLEEIVHRFASSLAETEMRV